MSISQRLQISQRPHPAAGESIVMVAHSPPALECRPISPVELKPTVDTQEALERFGTIVSLIYETAVRQEQWRDALVGMRRAFHATGAMVILAPDSAQEEGLSLVVVDETFVEITDFRKRIGIKWPLQSTSPEGVTTIADLVAEKEWLNSTFYHESAEPNGIHDMLFIDVRLKDDSACRLRFFRPKEAPRFGVWERQLAELLLPHLKRAAQIGLETARHRVIHRRYADACNRLGVATFMLDTHFAVLDRNLPAEELLVGNGRLILRNGRLAARDSIEDRELQKVLREVLAGPSSGDATTRVLALHRSGDAALGLLIQRVTDAEKIRAGRNRPAVIVFARDPEFLVADVARAAQILFDLTQSESALAVRLANGMSLVEAAQDMNIRPSTARTHLRSIFMKTGTTRQSSLVRQMLNSVALLTGSDAAVALARPR